MQVKSLRALSERIWGDAEAAISLKGADAFPQIGAAGLRECVLRLKFL